MEKWKRSRPKKICLSVTDEQKELFDRYCQLEDIKKQVLLEEHLEELFNKINNYFEGRK